MPACPDPTTCRLVERTLLATAQALDVIASDDDALAALMSALHRCRCGVVTGAVIP
jgi:hypothetical protein